MKDMLVRIGPGIHAVDLREPSLKSLCGLDGSFGSDAFVTCPQCLALLLRDTSNRDAREPVRS